MNKIYKVIWSKVKNSYVVVPEIAVSSSKNKRNKAYKSALVAVLTAMLGFGGFVGRQPVPVLLLSVMRPVRQPADLCLSVLVPVRA